VCVRERERGGERERVLERVCAYLHVAAKGSAHIRAATLMVAPAAPECEVEE